LIVFNRSFLLLIGLLAVCPFIVFAIGLGHYLSRLEYPRPVFFFFLYIVIAMLWSSLRNRGLHRHPQLISALLTLYSWAVAPWIAAPLHDYFKERSIALLSDPEWLHRMSIGQDYVQVIHSGAFGVGTCLFTAMILSRLILQIPLKRTLVRLIPPPQTPVGHTCPTCGRPI